MIKKTVVLVVWNALINNVIGYSSIKANCKAPSDFTFRTTMSARSRRVTLSFHSNAEHLYTLIAYMLKWDKQQ